MNRSGYTDDFCDNWSLIMWRGAVTSAIRGKRGQDFLKRLATYMDAMPKKELVADDLVTADGEYCALGVALAAEGIDADPIMKHLGDYDPEWGYEGGDEDAYWDGLSAALDIAGALAREIMFINDDSYSHHYGLGGGFPRVQGPQNSPEKRRWAAVRSWVEANIRKDDGTK